VGETLRHALNVLAEVAPSWLRDQIAPAWFDRYIRRVEKYRLPKGEETCWELIGAIGRHPLQGLESERAPTGLRDLPAVEILRQVWEQQNILLDWPFLVVVTLLAAAFPWRVRVGRSAGELLLIAYPLYVTLHIFLH
jgi:hypothetical protein